jgi:hypothetical protein
MPYNTLFIYNLHQYIGPFKLRAGLYTDGGCKDVRAFVNKAMEGNAYE